MTFDLTGYVRMNTIPGLADRGYDIQRGHWTDESEWIKPDGEEPYYYQARLDNDQNLIELRRWEDYIHDPLMVKSGKKSIEKHPRETTLQAYRKAMNQSWERLESFGTIELSPVVLEVWTSRSFYHLPFNMIWESLKDSISELHDKDFQHIGITPGQGVDEGLFFVTLHPKYVESETD